MFLQELYYTFYVIALILASPIIIFASIFIKLLKVIKKKQKIRDLKDQVAVITGSAGGLGRILAIELAKLGCHVAIVDIQGDLAQQTAKYIADNYKIKAKSYKVDVTDYYQLEELNKNVTQDLGDITILINNAAIMAPYDILNFTPQEIQQMTDVNFNAICYAHQIFVPKMISLNRGHIVNMSSASFLFNSSFYDIYASTKAAVRSISSGLRIKLKSESKNISVTTVMPAILNTNKRVESMIRSSGINKLFPIIEGTSVAKYILDAMLSNDSEITIPNSILCVYKIVELFPISIKELFLALLTSWAMKNYLNRPRS